MKLIAALATSATILAAQSTQSAPLSITAVRHWTLAGTTRIAVEVSGDFQYRTDRLHNPERVYFDILNARMRIDSRRFYSQPINDKLVNRVRVAQTAPGITRIVLDLTGAVDAIASQLANPTRLMVELRAGTVTPVTPAATMVTTLAIPPATDRANLIELPEPPAVAPLKNEPLPSVIARSPVRPPLLKPAMTPPAPQPTESAKAPILRTPAPKTESLPIESAKAARRTTAGNSSLIRTLGLKLGRVVIDPGHGGHDQGTESARGLLEKDLVLDVAKRVGKLIEDRLGAEVIYTRSDDTFIPLEARTALANDNKADLFLSIHANSSPAVHIAGVETYFRSFTTARDALDVAARENATSQKSIAELEDVIHTMMLGEKVEESKEFAARVQASLFAFSARNFPGIRDRGVKKAPFVVLAGAKAPSVLVEIGFLSNAKEESLLHKGDYRQKLAEALFRGVSRYAEGLSHFAVAKARPD